MKIFPVLYHKAKQGELRQWKVWADKGVVYTEYGTVGGKLQISSKKATPKNVGRSNATTAEKQAELEAQALHTFKLERKYSLSKTDACEELMMPMLAKKFEDKDISYPCSIQMKYDGLRTIAYKDRDGKIFLLSRSGKLYTVPHIQEQLSWISQDDIFDGELYIHGQILQKITSLVKSADPNGKSYKPESINLNYHVYDMPVVKGNQELTWKDRKEALQANLKTSKNVRLVETQEVDSYSDLLEAHSTYIEDGYEGSMIRLNHGLYLWGYRSSELLKLKDFQDSEFEVIGADQGIGKMEGKVIFICRNDLNDLEFRATMKVPLEVRKEMWDNRKDYIGRMLTVKYFSRTKDKIPSFPVGINFRDD